MPRQKNAAAPHPDEARVRASYRLRCAADEAEGLARTIAFEQTVELPPALVNAPEILSGVVGRVDAVQSDPDRDDCQLAHISYRAALSNGHLPQLANLVFGNASLLPGVRLMALQLPDSLLARFRGPGSGIVGLRRMLGVYDRPLLATALKPRGTPMETLAAMARDFALAGGDIVKDDQNLVDDFEGFKRRVACCQQAVDEANARSGRRCLYLPHVAAPTTELGRYVEYVHALGLRGVLVCPLIMGLDTARALTEQAGLVMMAHPALAGNHTNSDTQGIAHGVLLGTLMRLAGADISIFPNVGGRFAFTRSHCADVRDRLREPLGALAPAWPCPAGGMRFEDLGALFADYGADTVLLVGGALLGHTGALGSGTREFLDVIRGHFDERLEAPGGRDDGAGDEPQDPQPRRLAFQADFEWEERPSTPYKDADTLAFKGVRRVELVGKFGERTNSDLRYFEVEPGGFTSLEKHLHTHVLIGVRGRGVLLLGKRRMPLTPMDVAYVEPLEVHQLHNESDEPFGFFCIVDHTRDRPMKP